MTITIVQQDLQYHVIIARHFGDKEVKHADENWKDWYELHDAGGIGNFVTKMKFMWPLIAFMDNEWSECLRWICD